MTVIKNIWKFSVKALLIAVFSLVTTEVVEAKTVTTSNSFIDQASFNYFGNVYLREDYKYSVIASEYVYNSAYNYVSYYYVCLTNTEPNVTDSTNINASCDKLLRYTRNRDNNSYEAEVLNDNELKVTDTLYYYLNDKNFHIETYLFIVAIFSIIGCLFMVFMFIFKG